VLQRFANVLQRVAACSSVLTMGWLRLVGSLKSEVSFAEYRLIYRALLQKRPIILRSLLIEATPYRATVSDRVLQCVAVCCSVLQGVAVCCSVLQRVAVWCSVLTIEQLHQTVFCNALWCVAVCYSVLQCVAVRCSVLQRIAVC